MAKRLWRKRDRPMRDDAREPSGPPRSDPDALPLVPNSIARRIDFGFYMGKHMRFISLEEWHERRDRFIERSEAEHEHEGAAWVCPRCEPKLYARVASEHHPALDDLDSV